MTPILIIEDKANVARVAETHGGRAWVEAMPGEGATFWTGLSIRPRAAAVDAIETETP